MCVRAREQTFACMDEWGWQGYNLLQTARGQRRGGRDSNTERESTGWSEREGERGEARTSKEEMSLAGEKKCRRKRKKKSRDSRGEVEEEGEWDPLVSYWTRRPRRPHPPIVIVASVGAGEAANSSDICAVFAAESCGRACPSAPTAALR